MDEITISTSGDASLRKCSMHINIVLSSRLLFGFGLLIAAASITSAVLLASWWPLLALVPAILFMFRLENDPAAINFRQLAEHENCVLRKSSKHCFGVVGDYFVISPISCFTDEVFTTMLELAGKTRSANESLQTLPIAFTILRIKDIESVNYKSNNNTATISLIGDHGVHTFPDVNACTQAMEILRNAAHWEVDEQTRKAIKLQIYSLILCAFGAFAGFALTLTGLGFIQPNQLPLVDFNQAKKMRPRGKGAAILYFWVGLSECYLWLNNNCHPIVTTLLGLICVGVFAKLMLASQQTTVTEYTLQQRRTVHFAV
jgi:hypothetical protein